MCYTDDDDALWQEDPYEYIKIKFGKQPSVARTSCYDNMLRHTVAVLVLLSYACQCLCFVRVLLSSCS